MEKTVPSAIGQLTLNNDYFGFTSPISFIPNFDNISENDREWFTNLNISEYNVEFKNYNNSISFTADISKDQTDNNKLLLTSLTGDLPELNTIYENITMIIPSVSVNKDTDFCIRNQNKLWNEIIWIKWKRSYINLNKLYFIFLYLLYWY